MKEQFEEHHRITLKDANELKDLIEKQCSYITYNSSIDEAVIEAILIFYDDEIKYFNSHFRNSSIHPLVVVAMLPADKLIPFVTSTFYNDKSRIILDMSGNFILDESPFCETDCADDIKSKNGKSISVRDAVKYCIENPFTEIPNSILLPNPINLATDLPDGSWMSVFTNIADAEYDLKELHDILKNFGDTRVERITEIHPSGIYLWVYEVTHENNILARYPIFRNEEKERNLKDAFLAGVVRQVDFGNDGDPLRPFRAEKISENILSVMTHEGIDGEPEGFGSQIIL